MSVTQPSAAATSTTLKEILGLTATHIWDANCPAFSLQLTHDLLSPPCNFPSQPRRGLIPSSKPRHICCLPPPLSPSVSLLPFLLPSPTNPFRISQQKSSSCCGGLASHYGWVERDVSSTSLQAVSQVRFQLLHGLPQAYLQLPLPRSQLHSQGGLVAPLLPLLLIRAHPSRRSQSCTAMALFVWGGPCRGPHICLFSAFRGLVLVVCP